MEKTPQINIIHQLNYLKSGLNFIVPSQWWNQLLKKNEYVSQMEMMQELDEHPLKFIYQIDLIQICFQEIEKQIQMLQTELLTTIKTIDSQLKEIKRKERSKMAYKRSQSETSWWKIRAQNNAEQRKVSIVSPKIKLEDLNELFDQPDWRVVSPSFYKLICHNKYVTTDHKQKDIIIGIPVFIQQIDGHYELTYKIRQQIPASLYFHNLQKKDYCFIGHIQPHSSFYRVTSEIYSTCQQMALEYQESIPNTKRNKIYLLDRHLYYSFQDYQRINQELPWLHADQIGQKYLRNTVQFKMIEISTYSDQVIENVENPKKMIEENESKLSQTKKKRKQQQGFQYHESTEGQTQQSNTEKSFTFEKKNRQRNLLELQRITHPLLIQQYNIAHLNKLSKQNMKKSIQIPFSNTNNRLKTYNNKYIINKSCNKLSLNAYGEYEEIFDNKQQNSSDEGCEKKVQKQVIQWLQRMALTIVKPEQVPQIYYILEKQKVERQERQQMTDNIKQKLQCQSQKTQKMQEAEDSLSSSQL